MVEDETDFEDDSFDEDSQPCPESIALSIASECPLHCDGLISGDSITERSYRFTPKLLKKLVAQVFISLSGQFRLHNRQVPSHLYPLLFGEAARTKNDAALWYLLSTWPYEVFNFNELEIPLESHMGFFSRSRGGNASLAQSVIRGLFYRSRMKCRLKMIILPKAASEAAEIMKTFLQTPVHYLRDLPDVNLIEILKQANYFEGEQYLKTVQRLEFKRPVSYATYRKDKLRLVIVLPSVAVHFHGMKQNYDDVIVGLILQRHSPFIFHFENLAICNFPNSRFVGALLDRMANPEGLQKLVLCNKYFYKPEHIATMMLHLSPVLQKLTGLRGFYTRLMSILGVSHERAVDKKVLCSVLDNTLGKWHSLERISLCEQPLLGHLDVILSAISTRLVKLSLIAAQLEENDICLLGQSKHVESLTDLLLGHNNLHSCIPSVQELLLKCRSLRVLQMQHCMLSFDDCMKLALTLRASHTIRSWSIVNNQLHTFAELKTFLISCSKIVTLKEVSCLPTEYECVFGHMLMNNKFHLTKEEKVTLNTFSESLGLDLPYSG